MSISKLRPFFDNDDIESILEKIRDILDGNSYLTMGKYGERFEEEFTKYNGKYNIYQLFKKFYLELINFYQNRKMAFPAVQLNA